MAKVLFIGDIIGKPGREIVREVLPSWIAEHRPDLVVANVENLAHGKGVTVSTLGQIADLGIDVFTSGNHVFDKGELSQEAFGRFPQLIRPANYPENLPGYGYARVVKGGVSFLVLNLNGRVFFDRLFDGNLKNPFYAFDELIGREAQVGDIIVVDFHAEATSEKVAFGWYVDGRAAAVIGTHSHVPTADARVLPGGTAYITDAGMTGPRDGVIGAKAQSSLNLFLERGKFVYDVEDTGPSVISAVLVETNGTRASQVRLLGTER